MEEEPAVILENASVRYRSPVEPYVSFKQFAIQFAKRRVMMKDVLALQDVSLVVKHGETFGIIGRNGAGKSTLLKLVSRVLAPSEGRVLTNGIVAPLLELGAGFNFELTGKENIFLYGAFLGHPRKEIKIHLSEIIDFAQINGYIDAPLRTYSNGMVARLGFAVATSWFPDILLLDEILAVGDEEFRKKCFLRINSIRSAGSTILLVTHDLNTIKSECDRAVWLEKGVIQDIGLVETVADAYLESINQTGENGIGE